MEIKVRKTKTTDSGTLCMLWQFYQYHQSSFDQEDVGTDGRFDIDEQYLNSIVCGEQECAAYLIFVSDQVAGFATVETTEIRGKEMPELADIFILPKYRKQSVGKFVVQHLMQAVSEQWHVAVYINDSLALKFWSNLFTQLNVALVEKVEPAETEGFYEFVITNA